MFLTLLMALFLGQSAQAEQPVQVLVEQTKPMQEEDQQRPGDEQEADGKKTASSPKKKKPEEKKEAIGVIKILDDIGMPEDTIKKIIGFAEDPMIKGILLVINSYGGACGASEMLCREIKALSLQKPVVVLVVNGCCSGAYWAAIAADWIVAPAGSDVGSIGVKQAVQKGKNYKETNPGWTADLDIMVLHAGKFKSTFDARSGSMNEEQLAYAQEYINKLYEIFTSFVAQARNLSLEKVSEWADGQEFTGAQALKLGLIDQLGGYSDAVKKLKELICARGIVVTEKLTFVE